MENSSLVLPHITERKSIRAFSDKPVEKEKLTRLFDAARWAASAFNEQPWRFIYADKSQEESYQKLFNTLNSFNQAWAKHAPVVIIVVAKTTFSENGQANPHAMYDTGAAVANLSIQATAEGLYLHQMAGFSPEKAKETLNIPEGFEAVTAIVVGYKGDANILAQPLKDRETAPRVRKDISEFTYEGSWV
ncbi:MAG: nitroreductase [Thalassobius sp.]|nr:nitroreductase [Thalassovita sp.]